MNAIESPSLAVAREIDRRCDQFEQALAAGATPEVHSHLEGIAGPERESLLLELLGLEIDFRLARGEQPQIDVYATRFPELSRVRIESIVAESRLVEDAMIGRKLHIYQCVSLVGAGAMGRVYLARHDDLQRNCALKILSPRRGTCDAEYVARFLQEGRAAAALIHPNIVALHAVGHLAGTHFLEMEYVPGRSLQQVIRDEGPLPEARALELATMVAEGLAAAHRAGIVHRDVKPDNVMVTRGGIAKIGDFGLARRVVRTDEALAASGLCGTPGYMAPELFHGTEASPASDVYALGIGLFQMLTGRLPWHDVSLTDLVRHGRTESVPDVRSLQPQLSVEVAECVRAMTATEPKQRPTDAAAASRLLHAVLGLTRDLESLLIEAFGNDRSVSWTREGEHVHVTRQLPDNRRQTVVLESTRHLVRDRILLIYSVCCRALSDFYEQALMQNAIVLHGSLAIREINGQKMFVVINAYPRSTVAPEEIRRSVIEIATQADQVEKRLTGQDCN